GGHSLLAMRLINKIRDQLNKEISLRVLFECADVKAIADVLDTEHELTSLPEIQAVSDKDKCVLSSYAQQRLYFLDALNEGQAQYNMPVNLAVSGVLDLARLEAVIQVIIARHETLRTTYTENKGEVYLSIQSAPEQFKIEQYEIQNLSDQAQQNKVNLLLEQEARKPFDLSNDLMIRAMYLKTSSSTGVLCLNMHHIATDGWSMELLVKELFTLYRASSDAVVDLPELAVQYSDYALWQRTYLNDSTLDKQLAYWQTQLDALPTLHGLPIRSESRPSVKGSSGAILKSHLNRDVKLALESTSAAYRLTPFMLMQAALALVLSRHSNSDDIVIGTPVANRRDAALDNIIGFFVNTLVLR
ncbi:condensation domain-containing protein, partial [Pseudoalteromonas luteoviolacea]|uniref:condensation domain-containing protein n=1 Tax=Pseudoalteromonas luteoviolacea TaxID=43657 RepID=UPI000B31D4D0